MAYLRSVRGWPSQKGFTLIELLVAISVMALMAVMGWQALAGMQQATTQTRTHTDAVLTLEAGLAQWGTDLDALAERPFTTAMDWDGRALRITRNHSADASEGVLVVAWTLGMRDGATHWLRWQSTPVRSRQEWNQAWAAAAAWAQSPSEAAKRMEVAIAPMAQWQLYYYRGGTWSNPMSSSGETGTNTTPTTPDGVRLVLTVPSPNPLAGTLNRDWARPTSAAVAP